MIPKTMDLPAMTMSKLQPALKPAPLQINSTLYPRTYRAALANRIISALVAAFMIGTACMMLVNTVKNHHMFTNAEIIGRLFQLACMLVTGFLVLISNLRTRLVLTSTTLEAHGIFKIRCIQRNDILGFCVEEKLKRFRILESQPGDLYEKRRFKLDVKPDNAFLAWFEGLDDLQALEQAAAIREIEQDGQLGRTPAARVKTAKWCRIVCNLLLCLCLLLFGLATADILQSRLFALFTLAVLPWVGHACFWKYGGSIRGSHAQDRGMRAYWKMLFFLAPIMLVVLLIINVNDDAGVNYVDAAGFIGPLLVCTVLATALFSWLYQLREKRMAVSGFRRKGFEMGLAFSFAIYFFSMIAFGDTLFDNAPVTVLHATIVHKPVERSGRLRHYFMIALPSQKGYSDKLWVTQDIYDKYRAGDTLCLALHPGAFGIAWYTVREILSCREK
jgi:uncharacterized integral membrane protein